jgi:intein/homing endonuclease
MSWETGNQIPRKREFISNEDLLKIDGHLEEREAKLLFYQFLRNNISFSTDLITGVKIFPFQHMLIKSMFESDYFLGVLSRGASKSFSTGIYAVLDAILNQGVETGILSKSFRQCLEQDEYVLSENGLKQIKDLNIGERVCAKNELRTVKNKWFNEVSDGLEITTKKGYSIKAKKEHRVLIYDSNAAQFIYKEIQDLKIGDCVPIATNESVGGQYLFDEISVNESNHHCFKPLKNFEECDNFYYLMGYEANKIAINKEIPNKVFKIKKEFQASFIRGLMDSDGYFSNSGEIALATSSIKLAKQFQLLLLTFGIVSKLCKEKSRGDIKICGKKCIGRESYKVRITNYYNLKKYHDLINFSLPRKKQKLENYLSSRKRVTNQFVVPNLGNLIHDKYKKKIKHGVRKCNFKGNVNKYSIKKILELDFLDAEDVKKLSDLANCNFYFDKITEIKNVKNIKTVDIEVEEEHCYWGGGFINHNSKMIFKKIEDIAAKPEAYLLKQCITHVSKGNDEWVMEIGKSRIRALPLGDGEKLRGFRFHRIIIDEFLLMPERIYNEVIVPFLSVVQNPTQREDLYNIETQLIAQGKMKEEDRYQWPNNKLIALSSASFKFEYLYKLYEQYDNLIFNPKRNEKTKRCIMQLSYDCMPFQLYDQNLINQARSTMSESQFMREFGAQFTDDSSGYFKISKMALCTVPDGEMPAVEVVGCAEDEYIVSIDPSWSETESSDDFAIQVLKLNKERQISTLVHSYALSGSSLKDHIKYFLYVLKNFNVVAICMDYNGGVQFMNSCNESELFKSENIELKSMLTEFERPEDYQQNIISAKSEYNKTNFKYVFLRKPTSSWIRNANELLQANFDHQRIYFGSRAIDDNFRSQTKKRIGIHNLKYSNVLESEKENEEARMIDFVEHLSDMILLTKTECALIQITTSSQGMQNFDLPPNLKRKSGPDKPRKDSYSALVLGNWLCKIYFDMQNTHVEDVMDTFTPMFIA